MCKTWRLYKVFYLVCSHACVLALARFEYSEDLKVSPQEVWLTWWNFSTVICSFKNLFVSRFRPYSYVLGIIPKKTIFFSASLNYVWGIVRRKSLHYDIEDHLVRFAACHEWYTIHNLCWTRACHDHQPRRWSGMVWEYFLHIDFKDLPSSAWHSFS